MTLFFMYKRLPDKMSVFSDHWNELWKDYLSSRSFSGSLEEYWNNPENSEGYHNYVQSGGYPGPMLPYLFSYLDPDSTVLDIGSGQGTFSIPIARFVRSVTVVEPSDYQISRMVHQMDSEGIHNIHILRKKWEDLSPEEINRYTCVIAAHCFSMTDLEYSLQKMIDATEANLFLIATVENGLSDIYRNFLDESYRTGEYVYLYTMLSLLGCSSHTTLFHWLYRFPLQHQLDIFREKYGMNDRTEAEIINTLSRTNRLICIDEGMYINKPHLDGLIRVVKG